MTSTQMKSAVKKLFKNDDGEMIIWDKKTLRDLGYNGEFGINIESSMYYESMNYGSDKWAFHTKFHELFDGTGFCPEPYNSCIICVYKD